MEFDYLTRNGVEQTTKIEGLVSKTGPGSFSSSEVTATEASRSYRSCHRAARLILSSNIICPRPAAGGFFRGRLVRSWHAEGCEL